MATDMVRLQIQLTRERAEDLTRLAALRGMSLTALIREAVDALVGAQERGERWERARAAVGAVRSGRSDVSAQHDRYLAES